MANNIINDFWERLKIDYQEWRSYTISKWNVRRDQRMTRRALRRATIKNSEDGRTYYIMRDKLGGINELTSDQISFFTKRGVFNKMSYYQRLHNSIAIVTSNDRILSQYNQVQLKKENSDE